MEVRKLRDMIRLWQGLVCSFAGDIWFPSNFARHIRFTMASVFYSSSTARLGTDYSRQSYFFYMHTCKEEKWAGERVYIWALSMVFCIPAQTVMSFC